MSVYAALRLLEQLDLDVKRRERTDLPAHRKTQWAIGVYVHEDGSSFATEPQTMKQIRKQ